MFFPERILSIKPGDRVLDVGPGGTPHPRADVLLERNFDQMEAAAQRGYTAPMPTDVRTVFFDGGRFPFEDQAFDYVICSHVLEHVEEVPAFLSELCRVGHRGYLEFPTVYYDYLYNFRVHRNFIFYTDGEIRWMKKTDTPLAFFQPIQTFFYNTFRDGYEELVASLKGHFFQGFEWSERIPNREVTDVAKLCPTENDFRFPPPPSKCAPTSSSTLIRELASRAFRRVFS